MTTTTTTRDTYKVNIYRKNDDGTAMPLTHVNLRTTHAVQGFMQVIIEAFTGSGHDVEGVVYRNNMYEGLAFRNPEHKTCCTVFKIERIAAQA